MVAATIILIAALLVFAGVMLMSAALERLTAAVNAAVAKLGEPPVVVEADDAALISLAEQLENATNPAPVEAPVEPAV